MFRARMRAGIFLVISSALAQPTKELPSFEVASFKRSPAPSPDQQTFTVTMDDRRPSLVTYRNVSLRSLLMTAYHLEDYQIEGAGWIDSEDYDIIARVPANTPYSQRRLMLQRLLAERLQLKVYFEKKELPAYLLMVGKNPPTLRTAKVRAASADGTLEEPWEPLERVLGGWTQRTRPYRRGECRGNSTRKRCRCVALTGQTLVV
jgi:uncharacterized protein (TIGR03435 family)